METPKSSWKALANSLDELANCTGLFTEVTISDDASFKLAAAVFNSC